ncbi:MAG: dehydrogenase E1 component subunit alpha/beta [Actinomycetota bacterium]
MEAGPARPAESLTVDDLLALYRRMLRVRGFEERVAVLYRDGEIPGFVHLSIGQEASAVGACWPLGPDDVITSTHRGHGHCLAKGLDPQGMFAELLARDTGTCRGRGGSMHIADPSQGVFGANGIVAAGLPIAVGAGLAALLGEGDQVVVAFFGDGAVAQGLFHEAVNLAALWRLPVIFFCEHNGYAEFASAEAQHPVPLTQRAQGYGIRHVLMDGNDIEAVAEGTSRIVGEVRAGGGPVLVEARTYRLRGHYEGDPERYRSPEEVASWKARDPLEVARRRLTSLGLEGRKLEAVEDDVATELDRALEAARSGPEPEPASLHLYVAASRPHTPESTPPADDPAETFRTMDAVRLALEHELEADPDVFLAGIDIGPGGNVFGLTRGLHDRWPERVRDTPISESAIVGLAVGAAMAGKRPVVELMYLDFLGVCFDQLLNQAAKLRFMTGGRASLPLTLRTQFGAGRSSGSQHSQSLEVLFAHIPGLTVVMPSTPAETYGLLRSAIRDPNPVVFIENRLLYGMKGPRPPADHLVPLGRARVVRAGRHVTVVSVSRMVHEAVAAAELLSGEGIEVEVVDLRTVAPLDRETVLASVSRTGRLVVAHEAVTPFGIGAELAALAAGEGFWHLDAPVGRVGAEPTPPPYAPSLERAWLPDRDRIAEAVRMTARA